MTNKELVESIWNDLKMVNMPYQAHAQVEHIMRRHSQQIQGNGQVADPEKELNESD